MKTYIYNDTLGYIVSMHNSKVSHITPLVECHETEKGFFAAQDIAGCGLDDSDTEYTYDDASAYCYTGGRVIVGDVVNAENDQQLITDFVSIDYRDADLGYRMLMVDTNRFYDWTSYREEYRRRIKSADDEIDQIRAEWCELYNNLDTSAVPVGANELFDEMLKSVRSDMAVE